MDNYTKLRPKFPTNQKSNFIKISWYLHICNVGSYIHADDCHFPKLLFSTQGNQENIISARKTLGNT